MFPMKNPILNTTKATVIQYAVLTESSTLNDENDVRGKKGNTNDLFRKTINRFYELTSSSRLHDQLDSCLEYHK